MEIVVGMWGGDSAVFNGVTWDKWNGATTEVTTVAGRVGAVVLSQSDITGLTTTDSPTFAAVSATTFTGALAGNATTATNAGNVTGTVAIANGGTGAVTAAAAATALGLGTTSNATFSSITTTTASATVGIVDTGGIVAHGSINAPAAVLTNAAEVVQNIAAAPTAIQNFYVALGGVMYCNVAATNNFILNVAWSATTTFNSVVGDNIAVSLIIDVLQGSSPTYYMSGLQIDGVDLVNGTNLFWGNDTPPTTGLSTNGYDRYAINIDKVASATYIAKIAQLRF